MRRNLGLAVFFFFLAGCAAYKELEPKPEIFSLERGYVELKNDKEDFQLEKDTKYFIKFPRSSADRFYLVLVTRAKPALTPFLTNAFEGEDGNVTRIPDEASASDSVMVYAIDTKVPTFFWVIDTVRQNLDLTLRYRYVPQWRYTFENKYAEFQGTLAQNTVDRSTYNAINANYNLDDLNFTRELVLVDDRSQNLNIMKDQLLQLEKIFPKDIAASQDTAYLKYAALRAKVDDEMTFQENYSTVLSLFKKEKETRGNVAEFLKIAPFVSDILLQRDRFPARILEKARPMFLQRASEIAPYYDNLLRNKNDLQRISPEPSRDVVARLYRACGQQIPGEADGMFRFVQRFNVETGALGATNEKFRDLKTYFTSNLGSPPAGFYSNLVAKATEIKNAIPEAEASRISNYGNYTCAVLLAKEIMNAVTRANDLQAVYQSAEFVSRQINESGWGAAEARLRQLHEDGNYTDPAATSDQRKALVTRFESDLLAGVKLASQQRVDAFTKEHETTFDNVPALYQDSVFTPVYQLTFSSIGEADLLQKRKQVVSYLDQIKYYQFPETSIKNIYRDFSRNINDRGVEKVRAIVEHGRFYKGTDKQVKGLIDECNVNSPKWIVKPKEYRKLFALPVTSNKRGPNDYMFRIRLNIPSEAEFPVFDINIKLPEDVAAKAGSEQWYEEITLNKKPVKNEGRFVITSPTAANNYESQISPVQMDKAGNNILEIRFKHPSFKVFEVSAMAQVPIIRKN